jgi:hypothetical protein
MDIAVFAFLALLLELFLDVAQLTLLEALFFAVQRSSAAVYEKVFSMQIFQSNIILLL